MQGKLLMQRGRHNAGKTLPCTLASGQQTGTNACTSQRRASWTAPEKDKERKSAWRMHVRSARCFFNHTVEGATESLTWEADALSDGGEASVSEADHTQGRVLMQRGRHNTGKTLLCTPRSGHQTGTNVCTSQRRASSTQPEKDKERKSACRMNAKQRRLRIPLTVETMRSPRCFFNHTAEGATESLTWEADALSNGAEASGSEADHMQGRLLMQRGRHNAGKKLLIRNHLESEPVQNQCS